MTRNIVSDELAELNRDPSRKIGRYTFNAYTPDDYDGVAFSIACVRIGDHAHIEVETGRAIAKLPGDAFPSLCGMGRAGKLIMAWHDWLVLREALDADYRFRIAEVEAPTPGMAKRYA